MGTLIAVALIVTIALLLYLQSRKPKGSGRSGGTWVPPEDRHDGPEKPL